MVIIGPLARALSSLGAVNAGTTGASCIMSRRLGAMGSLPGGGAPVGSQKPIRVWSKSKTVTKCSRNTPPSTHRSSMGSCCIGAKPCRRRRSSSAMASRRPCPRRLASGAGSCAWGSFSPGAEHFVVFFCTLPPFNTSIWVQTEPSGMVWITSSTCSPTCGPAPPGPPPMRPGGSQPAPCGSAPGGGPKPGIGNGKGGRPSPPNGEPPEPPNGEPPNGEPPALPCADGPALLPSMMTGTVPPWPPPPPPPRRPESRSMGSGLEVMGFCCICSRQRSPPPFALTFLKRSGTCSVNSRPPSCTRKGSMP
mmetsp:Transcript_58246/g.149988  ORF Transcript_58246/g.149988 Transcript_58246/m.149988 type:complete len:307 (+) Transcript_58246:271-1191(+)